MFNFDILKNRRPFLFLAFPFIWQIIFFFMPIFFILFISLIDINNLGYTIFTFKYYKPFFSYTYIKILLRSALLAFFTSITTFLVGYPVAHFIAFKAKKLKSLLIFLLILPFWTNFLLHIYSWFSLLEKNGIINNILIKLNIIKEPISFLNSLVSVLLLMVYCYLPFMVIPIYSILEKFDKKLLEASADLGASNWQTLTRIILPKILPGIESGFLLVFVPSFSEFVIPSLMSGDKIIFSGNVIAQFILANNTISYGAAFTVICSITIIILSSISYFIIKKILLG